MKKENIHLKDMDHYVNHVKLSMNELEKIYELTDNEKRKNDIPFIYLAIKTIKGLDNKGIDINTLPKEFLNKFSNLSFDDAANILNIMYFKEDLGMKDVYKAIKSFYEFFDDNIDYKNERLNAIKEYIFMDDDVIGRLYRTILVIDINLLTLNDDLKFFDYLKEADYNILFDHFKNNKYKFDEKFNKNLFKAQYSYIKYYFDENFKVKIK